MSDDPTPSQLIVLQKLLHNERIVVRGRGLHWQRGGWSSGWINPKTWAALERNGWVSGLEITAAGCLVTKQAAARSTAAPAEGEVSDG